MSVIYQYNIGGNKATFTFDLMKKETGIEKETMGDTK